MPPRSNRNDRIRQDVTDISDASQLLRYAAASQLEPLLIRGITQGRIAQGADLGANKLTAGPVLAKALGQGLNARQLRGLDEIITALTPDPGGNTGGLSSLALRLSAGRVKGPGKAAWSRGSRRAGPGRSSPVRPVMRLAS